MVDGNNTTFVLHFMNFHWLCNHVLSILTNSDTGKALSKAAFLLNNDTFIHRNFHIFAFMLQSLLQKKLYVGKG